MRTKGMVDKPALKQLVAATGLSKGYAHDILSGRQQPSMRAAVHVYLRTGWKHDKIAVLTPEQIEALATVDPWA